MLFVQFRIQSYAFTYSGKYFWFFLKHDSAPLVNIIFVHRDVIQFPLTQPCCLDLNTEHSLDSHRRRALRGQMKIARTAVLAVPIQKDPTIESIIIKVSAGSSWSTVLVPYAEIKYPDSIMGYFRASPVRDSLNGQCKIERIMCVSVEPIAPWRWPQEKKCPACRFDKCLHCGMKLEGVYWYFKH